MPIGPLQLRLQLLLRQRQDRRRMRARRWSAPLQRGRPSSSWTQSASVVCQISSPEDSRSIMRRTNHALIDKWLETVKIPIVIVISLEFVSKRNANSAITHALQLLARGFRECAAQSELDMKAESYVGAASRMVQVFAPAARCGENAAAFRLICSEECAARPEDLWDVLKDKYAVLIGGGKTVRDLWRLMTNSNVTNLGALNTTYPPMWNKSGEEGYS